MSHTSNKPYFVPWWHGHIYIRPWGTPSFKKKKRNRCNLGCLLLIQLLGCRCCAWWYESDAREKHLEMHGSPTTSRRPDSSQAPYPPSVAWPFQTISFLTPGLSFRLFAKKRDGPPLDDTPFRFSTRHHNVQKKKLRHTDCRCASNHSDLETLQRRRVARQSWRHHR